MYYVCLENNEVTSILNYRPNVPDGVEVIEIAQSDMELIEGGKYQFDVATKAVALRPASDLQAEADAKANVDKIEFLNSTDWKVLRHIREKSLGIATSLSEAEYLELEQAREDAAKAIR